MVNAAVHLMVKRRLSGLQVWLIDEIFLCGASMFSMINRRIAKIKRTNADLPVTYICYGDAYQLQCAVDIPLNSPIN